MRTRKLAAGALLAVLASSSLVIAPGPAAAQWMSKWGHPVFTIGSTPYDSTNTGHAYYPGGPGFIPGYGYYPGSEPGHYPWMDGPGVPFDRRTIATPPDMPPLLDLPTPPVGEVPPPQGAAVVIVKVPAEAELWFDGSRTSQGGSYRRFLTPPLPNDHTLSYTIRARWLVKNAELSRVEEVRVEPGKTITVNFLTVDSWTGTRLELLPAPAPAP